MSGVTFLTSDYEIVSFVEPYTDRQGRTWRMIGAGPMGEGIFSDRGECAAVCFSTDECVAAWERLGGTVERLGKPSAEFIETSERFRAGL